MHYYVPWNVYLAVTHYIILQVLSLPQQHYRQQLSAWPHWIFMLPWMHCLRMVLFPNNSWKRNFHLRKVLGKVLSEKRRPCLSGKLSYLCLLKKFLKFACDMHDRINLFGGPRGKDLFFSSCRLPHLLPSVRCHCPQHRQVPINSCATISPTLEYFVLFSGNLIKYYFKRNVPHVSTM